MTHIEQLYPAYFKAEAEEKQFRRMMPYFIAGLIAILAVFVILASAWAQGEGWQATGMTMTKGFEGFRATEYVDSVGIATVGYGFNRVKYPYIPATMTRNEADSLFARLYAQSEILAREYAGTAWERLTDQQKSILTDLAYNLGDRLWKFKTMRKALQAGDNAGVVASLKNSLWYKQVGNRARHHVQKWGDA